MMIFNYSTLNFNANLFTATFPVHAVLVYIACAQFQMRAVYTN